MKTKACSPGLALMSSKTFSSTSYITSPSAGRGTLTVFGMGFSCQLVALLDGGTASLLWCRPCLPVAARHGLDEGRPDLPGETTIGRSEDPEPEQLLRPPGP